MGFNEQDNNNNDELNFVFNWEGKEDTNTQTESDFYTATHTISGMGIYEEEEEDNHVSIDDLLKNVNAHNIESHEEEIKRLQKEQEEKEEADRLIREQNRAKLLKERAEEEAKEREIRRKLEEEEERRLAEELEAKRKANPLYRIKDAAADIAAKQSALQAEKKKKAEEEKAKRLEEEKAKQEKAKQEEAKESKKEIVIKEKKKNEDTKPTKEVKEKQENKKNSKPTQDKPDFEYLATHDQLTGMKNLTAYELDIQKIDKGKVAILFFDINDLKVANDTLGHAVGNKLITTVAESLSELFKDSVYRIGGDEFVVLFQNKKEAETRKILDSKISAFKTSMANASKGDVDNLTYSVSVGYAIGDGKKSIAAIQEEADQQMYADKQAYKAKQKKSKNTIKAKNEEQKDHDALLSDEQRMLKNTIKDNHSQASEESTEKIVREIQSKYNEVVAILVADKSFDTLFIMQDVDSFLNLVMEMDNLLDYSYIYAVYEGGTQFYGIDEYFDDVTDLFKEIGMVINRSAFVSEKELLKIKGINIFKQIYFD